MRSRGIGAKSLLLGGLLVAAACMDVAGPRGGLRHVSLNVYPVFDASETQAGGGDVDSFVIHISNPPLMDTIVSRTILPGQDTIQIAVQVTANSGPDTVVVGLDGYNSATGLLLYQGLDSVNVVAGTPQETSPVTVIYVGPGRRIKTLALAPHAVSFQIGGTVQFTTAATDSSDQAMPADSAPVVFITRNDKVVTVTAAGFAQATGNGSTYVVAQSVARSVLKDSAQITVAPAPPPTIGLSVMAASFADTVGSPTPPNQTISVTNGGGSTLSGLAIGTVSYGAGASNWLGVSLSGSVAPATITLSVNPSTLAAGHYTATFPVTATGATNSPQTVSVSLDVVNGPAIGLATTSAGFSYTIGGTNPADDTIGVSNSGGGSLTGLAIGTITYGAGGSGWLAASLDQTTAPAKLVLHVTPGSLVAGSYTATVPVTSPVASNSPRTVSVTFTVTGVPAIGLSPASVSFADTLGAAGPGNKTVSITNSGTGTLTGLAVGTVSYGAGATGWVSTSLNTSTAPATLTIIPVTTGLTTPGHYTATIPVTSGVATNSPQTVSVSIDVTYPPLAKLVLSPGYAVLQQGGGVTLTATGTSTIGTSVPVSVTFTSRNTGVATVTAAGGAVSAVDSGQVVIVADAGGGIADSIAVAVVRTGQAAAYAVSDLRSFDRVKAGDTVRVVVAVDLSAVSSEKLGSYTAEVDWNAAQLTFVSADTVSLGGGAFLSPTINSNNVGAGQLKFGGANANGYAGPTIGLLKIKFVAAASGGTPVTFLLTDLTAAGTFTNLLTTAIIASSRVAVQ